MIRKKDGVHIEKDKHYVLDSRSSKGDVNFVSHAHSDHALKTDCEAVCSKLTGKLIEERFNTRIKRLEHSKVELIDSGHILGSTAALVDKETLYTGDVSTRDRAYLKGFKPVKAEKLVIEATYGVPAYRFPKQKEIEKTIQDWIQDTPETVFLFAYSLGKAQKIQYLIEEATERPLIGHKAVIEMNKVISDHSKLDFKAEKIDEDQKYRDGSIFIFPPHLSRTEYVQKLVEKHNGVTIGFSGWALNSSMGYSRYDKTFPFSDHCDFNELVDIVESVDPDEVYTHHGFDEAFASYLRKEKGFNARALKNNQSSLTEFQ